MQRIHRFLLILLASAVFFAATPALLAQTLVVTVGPGEDCDFDNPRDAVDSFESTPADERIVRITRGVYEDVAIQISSDQMTLLGGFETCSSAEPTPFAKTILQGSGTVVRIDPAAPGLESRIEIESLNLEDGFSTLGGGGLRIAGPADVDVRDSLLLDNSAPRGGGVFVDASEGFVRLSLLRTGVNGNDTVHGAAPSHGGGIYCTGDARIFATDGTIGGNTAIADGHGGGVYLTEGCDLELRGGVSIERNRAHRGGGLAATGFAEIRIDDASLTGNRAEPEDGPGLGGGVYLERGHLRAFTAFLERNRAEPTFGTDGGRGGAIYVTANGSAFLDARTKVSCPALCLQLRRNEAAHGAAAFATDGGSVNMINAVVADNSGDRSVLAADGSEGGRPVLTARHSFLTQNVAPTLVDLVGLYILDARNLSIGGNFPEHAVISAGASGAFVPSEVALENTIVHQPGIPVLDLDPAVELATECSLFHSRDGIPVGTPGIVTGDPLFVDPAAGDLHLQETSPAIDACPAILGQVFDIDRSLTPIDQDVVPDDGTPLDIGADEVGFIAPPEPPFFADGFESGDLTAWAA